MKMLWNTSFAPKYYTKNLCPWMVLLFLCISHTVLADNTGFIEVRADRIVLYPQRMELQGGETMNGYSGKWSNNTTRNMFQSSVIYRPCDKHQLQLGYYRKFVNPAYLDVFPEEWPNADGAIQAIDRCFCLWRVEGKQTIQQPLGRTTVMA